MLGIGKIEEGGHSRTWERCSRGWGGSVRIRSVRGMRRENVDEHLYGIIIVLKYNCKVLRNVIVWNKHFEHP